MTDTPFRTSLSAARRLALAKQQLSGRRPRRATAEQLVETVQRLPYVQWDPVTVVAPSHLLSLFARVGSFRPTELDRLIWREKRLFQHWIPFASLVSVDDYALHASFMRRYPESLSDSWGAQRKRARAFLAKHGELRRRALRELEGGPLELSDFSDHARTRRTAGDWEPSSAVAEMLWHLLMRGEVMVVGHEGNQNLWGLPEQFLPASVGRKQLSQDEGEQEAFQRSLGGLGVATAKEVQRYFVRGCYGDIRATIKTLVALSLVQRVVVDGLPSKEERYVLQSDVVLLTDLETRDADPRVSLLPPFDNLVYDQARGIRLFGFDYVREQFLPQAKRRFGMWVLPIVWGGQFVGRIDARLDKEKRELQVLAVFAERTAPKESGVGSDLREELERLAGFLGAESVSFGPKRPSAWKGQLR